ncbi:unnamed protein product [Moneuplotes crassus]|uniref:RING-type domain-containing protein n=1 Tax=Euplotes crassus TaxID=5936 RepID=A0AAD1XJT5_EUPCR|nr:unnamed protein product [Moneuplotes crassus]
MSINLASSSNFLELYSLLLLLLSDIIPLVRPISTFYLTEATLRGSQGSQSLESRGAIILGAILIPYYFINRCIQSRARTRAQRRRRRIFNRLVRKIFQSPDDKEEETECTICLEAFVPGCKVVVLPCDDRHFFHEPCLSRWLDECMACPLCKEEISLPRINRHRESWKSGGRVIGRSFRQRPGYESINDE